MGNKLKVGKHPNLYSFWKPLIAKQINAELAQMEAEAGAGAGPKVLVNCASQE
jgi:cytoplasmic iron level regulating protein YaaA (DUF328/UPF0246 family)